MGISLRLLRFAFFLALSFAFWIGFIGCDNATLTSQAASDPKAGVSTGSEIRCEDGAMRLFYQTRLNLSDLTPGEKVRFFK